jgi:hypothetical protein
MISFEIQNYFFKHEFDLYLIVFLVIPDLVFWPMMSILW